MLGLTHLLPDIRTGHSEVTTSAFFGGAPLLLQLMQTLHYRSYQCQQLFLDAGERVELSPNPAYEAGV